MDWEDDSKATTLDERCLEAMAMDPPCEVLVGMVDGGPPSFDLVPLYRLTEASEAS